MRDVQATFAEEATHTRLQQETFVELFHARFINMKFVHINIIISRVCC